MNWFDFICSEVFYYITDKIFEDEDDRIIAKVKVDGWDIEHYAVLFSGKVYVGRSMQFKDLEGTAITDKKLDEYITSTVDLCLEFRKTKYSTVSIEDLKDKTTLKKLMKETKL